MSHISIPLGYRAAESQKQVGFISGPTPSASSSPTPEIVAFDGDSHMATIGQTGSGKSVSAIGPTLLTYPGSMVVTDNKGELAWTTARARMEMGHEVVIMNPFEQPGFPTDHNLNPFDLFKLANSESEQDALTIAQEIGYTNHSSKDPFWDHAGRKLVSGLIAHVATCSTMPRTLESVVKLLFQDDVVYGLANLLDSRTVVSPMAYAEIASFLSLPDITRGGVLATAQSFFKGFTSERLLKSISQPTSFDLNTWIDGSKPITIYIVIPPYRMHSHGALIRLWFYTLMMAAMNRTEIPDIPTLFLMDETSQLGSFDFLGPVHTIGRGYGLKVWTFWQSFSQLKQLYPASWSEIVDNCGVIQLFGQASHSTLCQFAELSGLSLKELNAIHPDNQLLVMGNKTVVSKRFNYLKDECFQGLYDPNPYYRRKNRDLPQEL